MKKKIWIPLLAGLFFVPLIGIYAAVETKVSYKMASQKVDIHIENYREEEGKLFPWEEEKNILPGQLLSKVSKICNDGTDCYVRVKLAFCDEKKTQKPLSWKNVNGIDEHWKKIGNYYYYTNVLEKEKNVQLFTGISIPSDWGNEEVNNTWTLTLLADAIQAENFTPDFESDDPWNMEKDNLEIKKAEDREVSEITRDGETISLEIAQGAEGFDTDQKDFFNSMEAFLPGSTRTGVVRLINHTGMTKEVYIRAETEKENTLLAKMVLEIYGLEENKRELLYQGPITSEKLNNLKVVRKSHAGSEQILEFKISLPSDADNHYSARTGKAAFYFSTDKIDSPVRTVKTADNSPDIPYTGFIFSGVFGVGGILIFIMNGKKNGKKKE